MASVRLSAGITTIMKFALCRTQNSQKTPLKDWRTALKSVIVHVICRRLSSGEGKQIENERVNGKSFSRWKKSYYLNHAFGDKPETRSPV
jgi:hypothetical protein